MKIDERWLRVLHAIDWGCGDARRRGAGEIDDGRGGSKELNCPSRHLAREIGEIANRTVKTEHCGARAEIYPPPRKTGTGRFAGPALDDFSPQYLKMTVIIAAEAFCGIW